MNKYEMELFRSFCEHVLQFNKKDYGFHLYDYLLRNGGIEDLAHIGQKVVRFNRKYMNDYGMDAGL